MARPDHRPTGAVALALAVVLALLVSACGGGNDDGKKGDDGGPADPQAKLEGVERSKPFEVGEVSLPETDATGKTTPFRLKATKGHLLFVAFGYTNCPDVCPTTLSEIRNALKDLKPGERKRIQVAFGTVDPERDTPKIMTDYITSFVPDGHALRVTDRAQLAPTEKALSISSQVVKKPDGEVEVAHTAKSFVIDDRGRVVVEWAFGIGGKAMAHDLRILLARQKSTSP